MAQSYTSWGVRSRREILNWDGSNSSSSTNQPSHSPPDHPVTPSAITLVHPEGSCSWCGQNEIGDGGVHGNFEGLGPAKTFCSEICFSQCRRAAFKRAKVCDWCKHVRHTVTYVDLHDGQRQLQFCTDKCRNQYKMRIFCAEASSLGVRSCTAPGQRNETSPSTSIDLREQSTGVLITPDLWLSDCELDKTLTVKLECNEETEVASIDSEPEQQSYEIPLNLVHSSRRNDQSIKRNSNLVEIPEIPVSKKGKAHRKHHSTSRQYKTTVDIPKLIPSRTPSLPSPATSWPYFPYPQQMVPSYILQSQFLALNRSLQLQKHPSLNLSPQTPQDEVIQPIIEPDKIRCEAPVEKPLTLDTKSSVGDERATECCTDSPNLKSETKDAKILSQELPENFIVLRIPYLIPLPIPVPIPIPLNIHEKYLNHILK